MKERRCRFCRCYLARDNGETACGPCSRTNKDAAILSKEGQTIRTLLNTYRNPSWFDSPRKYLAALDAALVDLCNVFQVPFPDMEEFFDLACGRGGGEVTPAQAEPDWELKERLGRAS